MTVLIVAFLLIAHGLVHASYLAPAPKVTTGPRWPFAMGDSWLITRLGIPAGALRVVGTVLVAATITGFGLAGLSVLGVAPAWVFEPAALGAAVASIIVLTVFFHPWIVLGFAIDAFILWVVLTQRWSPGSI